MKEEKLITMLKIIRDFYIYDFEYIEKMAKNMNENEFIEINGGDFSSYQRAHKHGLDELDKALSNKSFDDIKLEIELGVESMLAQGGGYAKAFKNELDKHVGPEWRVNYKSYIKKFSTLED